MDRIRAISSTALSLRKQAGLRVRLPLASLTVVSHNADALAPFEAILRDELNVKTVTLVELQETSASEYGITSKLTVNARAAGPRLGKDVQKAIQAARAGDWTEVDGVVTAGGLELVEGEYDLVLETAQTDGESHSALALLPAGGFVLLDTDLTPELEAEGLARDVIRAVQDTRKAAGLDVSDRIRLDLVFFDDRDATAIDLAREVDIAAETLAPVARVFAPATSESLGSVGSAAVSEWLASVVEHDASFHQDYAAGQFANSGRFIVAVTRRDGRFDV